MHKICAFNSKECITLRKTIIADITIQFTVNCQFTKSFTEQLITEIFKNYGSFYPKYTTLLPIILSGVL